MIQILPLKKDNNQLMEKLSIDYNIKIDIIEKEKILLMKESNEIIGISIIKSIDEDTDIISLIDFKKVFITASYYDGFLRAILNSILFNGKKYAVVLATEKNKGFFQNYKFKEITEAELKKVNRLKEYSAVIVKGYYVGIEKFFNQPCKE